MTMGSCQKQRVVDGDVGHASRDTPSTIPGLRTEGVIDRTVIPMGQQRTHRRSFTRCARRNSGSIGDFDAGTPSVFVAE